MMVGGTHSAHPETVTAIYHLCRVIVDDDDCKEAQLMLGRLANEFHRAAECGRVLEKEDNHGR